MAERGFVDAKLCENKNLLIVYALIWVRLNINTLKIIMFMYNLLYKLNLKYFAIWQITDSSYNLNSKLQFLKKQIYTTVDFTTTYIFLNVVKNFFLKIYTITNIKKFCSDYYKVLLNIIDSLNIRFFIAVPMGVSNPITLLDNSIESHGTWNVYCMCITC